MGKFYFAICCLIATLSAQSQTDNYVEEFTKFDKSRIENWTTTQKVNTSKNELEITAHEKTKWEGINILMPTLDLSTNTLIGFKVKSNQNVTVRIDLIERNGDVTFVSNAIPVSKSIFGDDKWNTVYFDLNGHFEQMWPKPASLNPKNITGINISLNPGAPFSGTVTIDSITFAKATVIPEQSIDKYVTLNQIGFLPDAKKIAIVNGSNQDAFTIVKNNGLEVVYSGKLSNGKYWDLSDETVKQAIFTDFTTEGTYMVHIPDVGYSNPFEIKNAVYDDLLKSSIKAFYYQRCSSPIEEEFGGTWSRKSGQADTLIYIHPSAYTEGRDNPMFTFSSPGGWYDAGDYNKYIVNCGITMYTLLSIVESYPEFSAKLKLNIPEKNNALPDVLDEILYNLRWMLTMQDPADGGVYHKLTHENFEPMEMPNQIDLKRYVMPKTTAASLDFCAVMAQASRVLAPFEAQLPGLADSCMSSAIKAWTWAKLNPKVYYDQHEINQKFKPIVYTGTYGDGMLYDEFQWAATELLISTGNGIFSQEIDVANTTYDLPNWSNVQTLGLISLLRHKKYIAYQIDTILLKQKYLDLVNPMLDYSQNSPFHIPMGYNKANFEWGSNANAANISMLLLQAYYVTKDDKYYQAALDNYDYLLGRNPLGYCYVTTKGSKSPAFLHHRPSEADEISVPIPGFLVGGPQPGREDKCVYEWSSPAKNYSDDVCSYSTNEIAINWNAPLAYISSAFVAHEQNLDISTLPNPRTTLVFPDLTKIMKVKPVVASEFNPIIIFPNLETGELKVHYSVEAFSKVTLTNEKGKVLMTDEINLIGSFEKMYNINLPTGAYTITVTNEKTSHSKQFIINRTIIKGK